MQNLMVVEINALLSVEGYALYRNPYLLATPLTPNIEVARSTDFLIFEQQRRLSAEFPTARA